MGDSVQFYDSIDINKIDEFLEIGQQEHLHLDFKTVNKTQMDRDDRKNLAKCISGFANSDGGVIVWGIEARKNEDGVDCAKNKRPIENIQQFLSRLNTLTGEIVSPLVEGTISEIIVAENTKGLAKTYVPSSDSGPHMAKGGEDRYLKRSGDSFYKMEHYDIEDMFGRRKKPALNISTRVSAHRSGMVGEYHKFDILIYVSIENRGRGSAKAPFLSIDVEEPYKVNKFGIDGNRHFGLPVLQRARDTKSHSYGASTDFVIHPDIVLEVTAISTDIVDAQPNIDNTNDLRIKYRLAAEDMSTIEGNHIVNVDEILKQVRSAKPYV